MSIIGSIEYRAAINGLIDASEKLAFEEDYLPTIYSINEDTDAGIIKMSFFLDIEEKCDNEEPVFILGYNYANNAFFWRYGDVSMSGIISWSKLVESVLRSGYKNGDSYLKNQS